MAKTIDLSPRMNIKTAEQELVTQYVAGERPLGETIGGMLAFSEVFKKGYGENVFGIDNNGMWLGGADYDNAAIQFSYDGTITINDKDTELARVIIGKGTF
jgi:hypothetical protein